MEALYQTELYPEGAGPPGFALRRPEKPPNGKPRPRERQSSARHRGTRATGPARAIRASRSGAEKAKRAPKHPSWELARPERFELPTTKFVAWYSIQLSYGREARHYSCRPGPRQDRGLRGTGRG